MSSDSIIDSYRPDREDYDEFLDANGHVRPAWQPIVERLRLRRWESGEFERRDQQLRRMIADNGITYNVYSTDEQVRQWNMDLMPLVFSQKEWDHLEWQLQQRAELVNTALGDFYGRQSALHDAAIPPFMVYANPSFLRACHGIRPVGGAFVQVYSADIARARDGSWWVLNDRIEASSGMGYVLENRLLSNRLFPELFRDRLVRRIKPFYDNFQEAIQSIHGPSDPGGRDALLTPGPANETYFEQSFLAKNMGFKLVEGADLTVRDNRLYFKTLKGRQLVRTLIRRIDSDWCDPLELRNDSLLGIPGLLNCLRAGTLGMANALGSGLMETVALPAFLPSLCQYYLNEKLRMPSVATWWCGQPKECAYVIENLRDLVIKRTFRQRTDHAIFGPHLSKKEIENLAASIRSAPEQYCAQEIASRATAPVYHAGKLEPRHFLLRAYLIRYNGAYHMMPGALARIAADPESQNVSMQHGGLSKDVWVMSNEASDETETSLSRTREQMLLFAAPDDISSRAANNLYWLGRYLERVESMARVLRIVIVAVVEDYHEHTLESLSSLLKSMLSTEEWAELQEAPDTEKRTETLDRMLSTYVWDASCPSSLRSGFENIRRIAFQVKDRLSTDTWQILSNMEHMSLSSGASKSSLLHSRRIAALEQTLDWLAALSGITAENMVQGLGWHFLMLGKRTERAYQHIETVRASLTWHENPDDTHLSHLLQYADSSITYRNRFLNYLEQSAVVDLLLNDANNPRSLNCILERLIHHLSMLPWKSENTPKKSDEDGPDRCRRLQELKESLPGTDAISDHAIPALDAIETLLSEIHQQLELRFFTQL
jgi:uncharacterized circularly permuted ATP-grasp superfamily protein/uncharacterized alpha-E superfamily protein